MQFKNTSHAGIALVAGLAVSVPAAHADGRPPAPMANSAAAFVNWHQGFEHGTDGWYDASMPGGIGWCGAIEQVTPDNRGQAAIGPSAGRRFATVEFGACNDFWTAIGVTGAPYAPGPDAVLYSEGWPRSGYVTELDVYLDPAWSHGYAGNFAFAGDSPNKIIQYAATVFPSGYELGTPHFGPHYFVSVEAADDALQVAGHEITSAGWYTFRFQFSDEGGNVRVDFELNDASGGTLGRLDSIAPTLLFGPSKNPYPAPVPTSSYGSGHVWFFDIAGGLQLPIDEHRVRRGR